MRFIETFQAGPFADTVVSLLAAFVLGTLIGAASSTAKATSKSAKPALRLNDKQRWVMAQLAADGKLTRRDVEKEFDVSDRTAKRVLGELSDAGLIEFDRASHPGFYRLK